MTDAELATLLATQAGELLLGLNRAELGLRIGAEGDRLANTLLVEALRRERPDDGLLSEEEKDNAARLEKSRVWIVDPLDGTREYGEDRSDWAVHVALAIDGIARVGAVALPGQGVTLSSGNPQPLPPAQDPPRMLVSRTRPPREALAVAEMLGAELVPMGSAGPRRWRSCWGRQRSTSIAAASTSGTTARPPLWLRRMACTSRGWTVVRWSTTRPIPICLIC